MKASKHRPAHAAPAGGRHEPAVGLGRINIYYQLTKPGIVYGNAMTMVAGFLFASREQLSLDRLIAGLLGTSLVIAAACVVNNYLDRSIDRAMSRTKQRALVSGQLQPRQALIFALVLSMLGFGLLLAHVNVLTALVGLIGFVDYVILYGWSKRRSPLGTLVGSISGATPIVAGYTAATGVFDRTALGLFIVMAIWQMPHFYAIAMYRAHEYAAAKLPVMPLIRGNAYATRSVIAYITLYVVSIAGFFLTSPAGWWFGIPAYFAGVWWLSDAIRTRLQRSPEAWARRVFFHSLIVLLIFSAALAIDGLIALLF